MKLKWVLIQNVLLILGVAALYEFQATERIYSMFQSRETGFPPLLDGEAIAVSMLGIPLASDEGVHWTNAMITANAFLVFGIIALIAAIGILLWNAKNKSTIQ